MSAATSAPAPPKNGGVKKAGHVDTKSSNPKLTGKSTPILAGVSAFTPTKGSTPVLNVGSAKNLAGKQVTNRLTPGQAAARGSATGAAGANAAAGPSTAFPPHVPSLPITTSGAYAKPGLNSNDQFNYGTPTNGGFIFTPPDQALAEGNGYVVEGVNDVIKITDTGFGHTVNIESWSNFWAAATLFTGYCFQSDPKAHYDAATGHWFITEVAYGIPGFCGPGSAVYIGVSETSSPLGPWNIYVLDTSFDGTTCGPDGCLADQPLLGMNRNALFISTNSFDWDSSAFNGAQMYIIDSTALASGFIFPNVVYIDIGATLATPEGLDMCGSAVALYCWYSIQPATTPNVAFTTDRRGTEFGMSALDFVGSGDTRVALWAFTNTQSISGLPIIFFSYAIAGTEAYKFPFTDNCTIDEFGSTCGFAGQPSFTAGGLPTCEIIFALFPCAPGPIANNDDRMNEVKSVKPASGAAHNWGGVNTAVLVPGPGGHLYRKSGIAYFDLKATGWFDNGACVFFQPGIAPCFLAGAGVYGQGYVANWNNDVVFPAIGVTAASGGTAGAMVYTLTGNDHFPSVAVSKVSDSSPVSSIPIALAGQDALDDFSWYEILRPRWGDYSAAVADGHTVYLATEYVPFVDCSDSAFLFDFTCGGTRNPLTNWGTGLVKVNV